MEGKNLVTYGSGRVTCRACMYRRQAEARAKKSRTDVEPAGVVRTDYLLATQDEAKALADFDHARARLGHPDLKCYETVTVETDGGFKEIYPHTDYDERQPPSYKEAQQMCRRCPLIDECLRLGNAVQPAAGVFGGHVFIDGKAVTARSKHGRRAD